MSPNLDLVRATAVLCVFFAHLYENYFRFHGYPKFVSETAWHFGQMGVVIFFVHTSLVLMQSLERNRGRIGDFYIRRAFRIYPLSIFMVTLAFILQTQPWTWREYAANLTLTMNLFYIDGMSESLWTLPLEVQMYIALPFLFFFGKSRPLWAMAAVWLAACVAGIIQPHITGRLNVLEFSPCFVAGVLSWRLSKSVHTKLPGAWWPLAFMAVWPIFLAATRQDDDYHRWAFALALGLAIPLFADSKARVLNAVSGSIAKYSYGIYLVHGAIIHAAFRLPLPAAVQIGLIIAAVAVGSFVLFHVIEDPMIQVGKRFLRPPSTAAAPALA